MLNKAGTTDKIRLTLTEYAAQLKKQCTAKELVAFIHELTKEDKEK